MSLIQIVSNLFVIWLVSPYFLARGIFWTFDCDMAYPLPFERIKAQKKEIEFGLTSDCDAHFSVAPSDEDSPTAKMYEIGMCSSNMKLLQKLRSSSSSCFSSSFPVLQFYY